MDLVRRPVERNIHGARFRIAINNCLSWRIPGIAPNGRCRNRLPRKDNRYLPCTVAGRAFVDRNPGNKVILYPINRPAEIEIC